MMASSLGSIPLLLGSRYATYCQCYSQCYTAPKRLIYVGIDRDFPYWPAIILMVIAIGSFSLSVFLVSVCYALLSI